MKQNPLKQRLNGTDFEGPPNIIWDIKYSKSHINQAVDKLQYMMIATTLIIL